MHLASAPPSGPWLQLMPDSSEDCMVLERLAAHGDPDVHAVRSLRDQAARYADAAALRGQQWVAEWLKQVGQ